MSATQTIKAAIERAGIITSPFEDGPALFTVSCIQGLRLSSQNLEDYGRSRCIELAASELVQAAAEEVKKYPKGCARLGDVSVSIIVMDDAKEAVKLEFDVLYLSFD